MILMEMREMARGYNGRQSQNVKGLVSKVRSLKFPL